MLRLRKTNAALHAGNLQIADVRCDRDVLAYYRTAGDTTFLVLLNFSKRDKPFVLPPGVLELSTVATPLRSVLGPYEGRVMRLAD